MPQLVMGRGQWRSGSLGGEAVDEGKDAYDESGEEGADEDRM